MSIGNITIFGVGRLGLCTALVLEKAGYNVVGVDISDKYVYSLNHKTFQTNEPHVRYYLDDSKNFRATTSFQEGIEHSDIYMIVVATPNNGSDEVYDTSHLGTVLQNINSYKVKNKDIVVMCTVSPTYTENIGSSLLLDCENTTLSYNPEFIAQGNIIQGLLNPDIVLIGEHDENSGNTIENIYKNTSIIYWDVK